MNIPVDDPARFTRFVLGDKVKISARHQSRMGPRAFRYDYERTYTVTEIESDDLNRQGAICHSQLVKLSDGKVFSGYWLDKV